jgi:RHH-type proline utilization regulon transcriptional repressor/proline dehydrogenase/delta 1-pyrroline-5-carboxylate dehydrogenase
MRHLALVDEADLVRARAAEARQGDARRGTIDALARRLVEAVRAKPHGQGGLDAFLQEYALSTKEGVVLMCLAEALLRIPDSATADRLIRDKIGDARWEEHLGRSSSLFVNASTWGLMLTGRIIRLDRAEERDWTGTLRRLVQRGGEPVVRAAMMQAMRIMGRQFVLGRTIDEALDRAAPIEADGARFSYDMLGEAARTAADAERHFAHYKAAISAVGRRARGEGLLARPGVSVKLSALHPRYEEAQASRVHAELAPRLAALAADARAHGVGLCVDAEEADRLELSLDLVDAVGGGDAVGTWDGFGLAVQAYQTRAPGVIDWLADLARRQRRRIPVRLVKGAYWDSEIKRAQLLGLPRYPVFTRKVSTDVSYLACARRLVEGAAHFMPQFATHNAHTLAAMATMAREAGLGPADWELQRLHGMGEALYDEALAIPDLRLAVRIYAPVGAHEDLLPYLVRRLLENGANSSFVNRLVDEAAPIDAIVADPVLQVAGIDPIPNPRIPPAAELYAPERRNSVGVDLADRPVLATLESEITAATKRDWRAAPLVDGRALEGRPRSIADPSDLRRRVGEVVDADAAQARQALDAAKAGFRAWDRTPADTRASILERAADLLEADRATLMALLVREAGKTLPAALAEVREAVDFLRYYAISARRDFAEPLRLPGPTGQTDTLALRGRGPFLCISPWNFPLAIFLGQVSAALAAGNSVVAKPAEQTPLVAARAVSLLHQAGVPTSTLHLVPGDGPIVGGAILGAPGLAGVAFTGSTETARLINRALAERDGPILPFIAETGGQNALIADSSALPEQVVRDALLSAFDSAGQRCSAARVLFVQDEAAPRILDMLSGAVAELVLGDPMRPSTDVGPVIDADACQVLDGHLASIGNLGTVRARAPLPPETAHGTFVAPTVVEIDRLDRLTREVFGPVLHVVRYSADRLDQVCRAIDATGYGLTLGIHTRIDETVRFIEERVRVGNVYVNRNMIGAVVGVQPFGGEGLSGTGPKAGGPRTLHRYATEVAISTDTTAAGGNASLLSLED